MTILLIILLVLAVVWFYYRQKKLSTDSSFGGPSGTALPANQTLTTFLKEHLNSASLTELESKLAGKTLDELLEENGDYETEVDGLTRTKNSLEADLTAQAEAFQSRVREKEREIKKLKEDLTSEKAQHKGSLERIKLLTEQITRLEKEVKQAKVQHVEQLRSINLLFDDNARSYESIDFEGLYALLTKVAGKDLPGSFPKERKDD